MKRYQHIIWGASPAGIRKALELMRSGEEVLLLNKFGFPGGKITEALACSTVFQEDKENKFMFQLEQRIRTLRHGIISQDSNAIVHPEAMKRAAWEILREHKIPILFHVNLLSVKKLPEGYQLSLFGREGEIQFIAGQLYDFSDDFLLMRNFSGIPIPVKRVKLNAFLAHRPTGNFSYPGLAFSSNTSIGFYISVDYPIPENILQEEEFNRQLDTLIRYCWEKCNVRMLMIPVMPELIFNRPDHERNF